MIMRTLRAVLLRTRRPNNSGRSRPLPRPRGRFEIETLEGRFAANCPLGEPWDFDLDHGFSVNNVYASQGWHESVINLTVDSGCVDSITWVVPPSTPAHPVIFKDYIHTHDEGRVVWFTAPPASPPIFGIGFYWGPVDETVTISATVTLDNGESKTKSATFDIDEPKFLAGPPVEQDIVVIIDPTTAACVKPCMAFQEAPPGTHDGVVYSVTANAKEPGQFFFSQLVNVVGTAELTGGGGTCSRSTSGWRLDGGSDPEAHYDPPVHTDANGNAQLELHDSPVAPLWFPPPGYDQVAARKVAYNFQGHLWLMYEADPDSRPVPVAHANWGWSATAVLKEVSPGVYEDGNDVGDWEIRLPSHFADPLTATDTWPEWQLDSYYSDPASGINFNWHCP